MSKVACYCSAGVLLGIRQRVKLYAFFLWLALGWSCFSEPASVQFTIEPTDRLTNDIVQGHKRWEQRLRQAHGNATLRVLRNLDPNRPGPVQVGAARFWQKNDQYREDVERGERRGVVWAFVATPPTCLMAVLKEKQPSLQIKPLPQGLVRRAPWEPNVRTALNFIVQGWPVGAKTLAESLQSQEKVIAAARLETQSDGTEVVVAELALTDKGATAMGLPGVPPKDWLKETVWLDTKRDYAIVKHEHVDYVVVTEMQRRLYGSASLADDHAGRWTIRRVRRAETQLIRGELVGDTEFEVEFGTLKFEPLTEDVFTIEALKIPPGTLIVDEIRNQHYPWQPKEAPPKRGE
jgi:heme exporter protein D